MKLNGISFDEIEVHLGKHIFKLAKIKNPEKLFDELLMKPAGDVGIRDEQIPYWGELWPSSLAMAEYILDNPELFRKKSVVEIGCGLGLPGIAAGKMNASVTLTDYLDDALAFADYNWKLNSDQKPTLHRLDWRHPEGMEHFDIVLASDVAYESRSFEPLIHAFKILLKPGGIALIAEPNRHFAKNFFTRLRMDGFETANEIRNVKMHDVIYNINIYSVHCR